MKNVAGQGDVPMKSPTSVQAPHQVSDTAQGILDRFFAGAGGQTAPVATPGAPAQTTEQPTANVSDPASPYAAQPQPSAQDMSGWRGLIAQLPQAPHGLDKEARDQFYSGQGFIGTVARIDQLMQAIGRDWEPPEKMIAAMQREAAQRGYTTQPVTTGPAPVVTNLNYAAPGHSAPEAVQPPVFSILDMIGER
ncbi:hypothetical protein [Mameliella sp.]|uniref:hypothetical protein n=1 Tax=Mameliella sp. TaxID=1924940 RepID=UPI003BAD8CDA